MEICHKTTI